MATTYYNQEDLRALFQSTFNINEWYQGAKGNTREIH